MKLGYFRGDLFIPDLIGDEANNEAIQETIDDLIQDYEAEFLTLLLGSVLYAQFAAGIALTPVAAEWTALQSQIYNEVTWRSPVANYIYFQFLARNASMLTGVGEMQATAENSVSSSGSQRMIRTWNRMSDMVDVIWTWLDTNKATYPEFNRYYPYWYGWQSFYVNPFAKINSFGI